MDFEEAVEKAPPGWRHFRAEDIDRLPAAVRAHELARVPRGETAERAVRGLFWTLVYHLEPDRWDELARHEPIPVGLLASLPDNAHTAIDVGAGSGRLTQHLVERSRRTIAVEPSAGLRALLSRRLPGVKALAGWAEQLPLRDRCAQLTAACGAFGPEPEILAELDRVTAPGGTIALVSPEEPDRFEAMGWKRVGVPPESPPPHPAWLDDFFGPLDPPHEMVVRRVDA